jgi:phenylacetate-CoA ligase
MPIRALHLVRQLAAERKPPALLQEVQLDKLRRLVHESYEHTVAYRCLMQRAGVLPEKIKTLQDIERLPVICKGDLLEFTEQERTNQRRSAGRRLLRVATSGSSGKPFEFVIDGEYDSWRKAQYLRPYVSNGRRPWHRVLRLTAIADQSNSGGSRFSPYRELRIACTAPIEDQLKALQTFRPSTMQGYPSALRCLAFEINLRKISTPYVRTVFTDSELLTPDSRSLIEAAFSAPVLDIFGTFETDNILYQCSRSSDYHVAVDSIIPEIIQDGIQVREGKGELVATVLNNLTSPFIRYNLEDVVGHVTSPCDCHRTFPLISILAGRADDLVQTASGQRRSPLSFLWRFDSFSDLLREYQIVQMAIDQFEVKVVPLRALTDAEKSRIRDAITADYPDACVNVVAQLALPRSPAEKLKAFVCKVPPMVRGKYGN